MHKKFKKKNREMGLFSDVEGDISSTRIFEALIIATVIIIAFISVFTGRDIGSNVANMLQFIISFAVIGCEGKKAIEYIADNNQNKKEGRK
jgi:hypothetical protein